MEHENLELPLQYLLQQIKADTLGSTDISGEETSERLVNRSITVVIDDESVEGSRKKRNSTATPSVHVA